MNNILTKLTALKAVVELTDNKVGLETINELIEDVNSINEIEINYDAPTISPDVYLEGYKDGWNAFKQKLLNK